MHNEREEASVPKEKNHTALLGKFAGFLAESDRVSHKDVPGIMNAFSTALNVSSEHDYWSIDSGATDHMTNQLTNLHDFKKMSISSQVSLANGKGAPVVRKGKNQTTFKLSRVSSPLSFGTITNSLNCLALFSPHNVAFQDITTKMTIGEGFFLNGLYYLAKDFKQSKVLQVSSCVA